MIIEKLKLENFRNYETQELNWDSGVNLLYGLNGEGKSNLLEAISYLGLASSFRGAGDQELIRFDSPYFFLAGEMRSPQSGKLRITAAASRQKTRKWSINHTPKTRLADIVGVFHTVIFAPEDIRLVKDGPATRRRYLNRQMSQLDQQFCRMLIDYNRILRQRNACLKGWGKAAAPADLEIWSEQLAERGSQVIAARQAQIKRLLPLAQQLHAALSGGEELEISYLCPLFQREQAETEADICQLFLHELQRQSKREQLQGMSLVGPHRDELQIFINGHPARETASQGQQRTVALSLKLAELELAKQLRGEYPVLLLDDVLSELDSQRRREILNISLQKTQTIITATDASLPLPVSRRFEVKAGSVTAIS